MKHRLTLGSLFDGSGGFPLAALQSGIAPVWASEVEPLPILVTHTNLPQVQHLGDIRSIHGADIEPVDVVTFGSPCQNLSVAGKQAGLTGSRSGLFFEAIRVIREMKEATNGRYPRWALWENVPGAFSSNKGRDFAAVLTSLIRLGCPGAPNVPVPSKGWEPAGAVVASGCSLAWRVLDAQHFGLAQRRKRIYALTDLRGTRAGQILFEPHSLQGNPHPSRTQEQDHADTAQAGTRGSRVYGLNSIHLSTRIGGAYGYEADISKTLDLKGGEPTCNQGGMIILQPQPVFAASKGDFFTRATCEQAASLLASDHTDPPLVAGMNLRPRRLTPLECCRLQGFPDTWCEDLAITCPSEEELSYWTGVWEHWCQMRGVLPKTARQVRKWLAAPVSDRGLYKLWGNGIALPVATHVLKRVATASTAVVAD